MTQTGHFLPEPESNLSIAVSMALLRKTGDTRAARLLIEILRELRPAPGAPGDGATAAALPPLDEARRLLVERLGIPPADWASQVASARQAARTAIARSAGIDVIPWFDASYSPCLSHVVDRPIVLWARGDRGLMLEPSVAVVGSRAATPGAVMVARRLGRELAEAGLVVVSGMARGVDGAAHEGALEASGCTIAVLGCGPDVVYPHEHKELSARIVQKGLIISELPPGSLPIPGHFPLRNRIISGLCRAVVVVEASNRSGSLITARMALEQGREVLAVPGNVVSGRSGGCHALIKDGAGLVETVEDVLEQIRWSRPGGTDRHGTANHLNFSGLAGTMAAGEAYTLDDLASRTGRPAPELLAELGALELAGRITRVPGGNFVRT